MGSSLVVEIHLVEPPDSYLGRGNDEGWKSGSKFQERYRKMTPFDFMTMSESGLKLLKIIFEFQSLSAKITVASLPDREKSAALLRKMATCLGEIEAEVQKDNPRAEKHVGSMRVYLDVFDERFAPFIGIDKAQALRTEMQSLFGKDGNGFMVGGFLELKEIEADGGINRKHVEAAFTTLILCQEQLEAYADVIEYV